MLLSTMQSMPFAFFFEPKAKILILSNFLAFSTSFRKQMLPDDVVIPSLECDDCQINRKMRFNFETYKIFLMAQPQAPFPASQQPRFQRVINFLFEFGICVVDFFFFFLNYILNIQCYAIIEKFQTKNN